MASKGSVALANHAHVFPAGMNPAGTIDHLLKHLDACDIAEAVCFAPFSYQAKSPDFDAVDWLAKELKGRDRLHAFGTLDFERANIRCQIKRIVDLGMKGIKIHPPGQKLEILSARAFEAYAAAQEANLFITFHTGIHHHRIRDAKVVDFDEICHHFPNLRFSMEHVGGWSFFNEALAVIENNTPPPWEKGTCKVYAGLTSIFSPDNLPFWYMAPDRLALLAQHIGAEQMIFGLDFPYNDTAATQRGIQAIRNLNLPASETSLILGETLRQQLGLA